MLLTLLNERTIVHKDIEIRDQIIERFELDEEDNDTKEVLDKLIVPSIKKYVEEEFVTHPYYQTIKIKDIKIKGYELLMDQYLPNELFPYSEISIDQKDNYLEKSVLGYFENNFHFIALNKNKETWMSVTPNEINTMKRAVEKAHGEVLVYGLGLGYFPFMISLKNDVKSIKIIEKDQQIIDIFVKFIFPQFPKKEKIEIIKADALSYSNANFDYAFIDLWHNPNDGLKTYIQMIKKENDKAEYYYWLEDSIIAYLRRLTLLVVEEHLEGYKDADYQKAKSQEEEIINKIYFLLKPLNITSFSQIEELISFKSLRNLAKHL